MSFSNIKTYNKQTQHQSATDHLVVTGDPIFQQKAPNYVLLLQHTLQYIF